MPEEWTDPRYSVDPESIRFMKKMIRRSWPSRISRIDENGYPWIAARMRQRGKLHYHSWLITESTGWYRVVPRKKEKK